MALKTRDQVSAELELTPQQISNLAKEDGCPREMVGRKQMFRWPEFNRWYWTRKIEEAREAARPVNLDEARARREAALAQQEELKLAEMRGELMTVADYRRVVDDTNARIAARLKTLPQKLAPAVVGVRDVSEGLTRVQPLVDEVMAELYRGEDVPEDEAA